MTVESSAQRHDPTVVERLLDRQRDSWRRGERVLVEALVEGHPALADDREVLLELICNEMDLRASRGETPRLDEYRQRFPTLSEDLSRQFEVFAALGSIDKASESKEGRVEGKVKAETALGDSAPPPPPTTVPPPEIEGYEVLGLLGKGGMGVVYQARQTAANRVVALKMILGGFADEEVRERFRTEAHAVARLQHPNVVQVFEVGEHRGLPFFSLEFCAGGNLEGRLKATPLPPREAARLVETLARAMHQAHERGVVHRDLKPANVLLTADGTPKVTDFGLAKKLDEAGQTQSGAVMGTPSYMAPEQAGGKSSEIGPATDVYALGAILYECLTGRPPFKAATLLDTLMQVREDDPVPPRQLQSKTPRDLETVCLKCLQKDPKRRYTSANALAEDLRRYQAGEPIVARPVGRIERAWLWGRRNPKDAALIASGMLAVVLAAFAYLWIAGAQQAAQTKATIDTVTYLTTAESLWEQAKKAPVGDQILWEKAFDAAQAAKRVIEANAVDEPTRRRVQQTLTAITTAKQEAETKAATAAQDERMKAALEKLAYSQLQLTTGPGPVMFNEGRANTAYEQVFVTYGIDLERVEETEARIRASAIKPQLVAALDAWIPLRPDERSRRQLADMADRLSEGDEFRRALREALVGHDVPRLQDLARRDLSALPPHVVYSVGQALRNAQAFAAAQALLRPAQQRYPGDFGINVELLYCLSQQTPRPLDEEMRFETAAVALRPEDSLAHYNLGCTLEEQGKLEEAVAEYRTAIQLDPKDALAHNNLGNALSDQGKLDEAVAEFGAAIQLDLKFAMAHYNLGNALSKQGKLDEAVAEYKKAIELDPKYAIAHHNLGYVLSDQGKLEEAVAEYKKAIELDPKYADAHNNLGNALKKQGKLDDAIAEYKKAIKLDPKHVMAQSNLGNALADQGKLDDAVAACRAAIELDPKYADAHNNLGNALKKQGKLDDAIAEYKKAIKLDPKHVKAYSNLGNALSDQGKLDEAVVEYRAAIRLDPSNPAIHGNLGNALLANGDFAGALTEFNTCLGLLAPTDPRHGWAMGRASQVDVTMTLEGKLPAVLRAEAKPSSAREGCDLAGICQAKKQYAASARLYVDSCAADPSLLQEKDASRYDAARASALAGCGQGKDAGEVTEPERGRWRKQALTWLRADLDNWAKQAASDKPEDRQAAARKVRIWLCHVDFAGVRDEAELKNLPEDEQTLWREFWVDVAVLVARAEKR